jgi:hypothetical protein
MRKVIFGLVLALSMNAQAGLIYDFSWTGSESNGSGTIEFATQSGSWETGVSAGPRPILEAMWTYLGVNLQTDANSFLQVVWGEDGVSQLDLGVTTFFVDSEQYWDFFSTSNSGAIVSCEDAAAFTGCGGSEIVRNFAQVDFTIAKRDVPATSVSEGHTTLAMLLGVFALGLVRAGRTGALRAS